MRRHYGILAILAIALSALTTAMAQNQQPCCRFRVVHNFRLCLPQGCQPQVTWTWNTLAAVWDLNNLPPIINTNSGTQTYSVPSNDTQSTQAVITVGNQTCANAFASAGFNINWITGTNCVQGTHYADGSACAFCRMHGANAGANSHITIACPSMTQGTVVWQPFLQDFVGSECSTQMYDPVIVRATDPSGQPQNIELFSLRGRGFQWQGQDVDGDGWYDDARIKGNEPRKVGHVTLLKGRTDGAVSRLRLAWDDNGIITESEATGEFADIQLPQVGEPLPDEGVRVPATFELPFALPDGWSVESIEMGGGGVAGQDIPRTPGDVNGDGCVDDADLLQVLFAFGGEGGEADVNGDGIVDDADLLIVLFNFGAGC